MTDNAPALIISRNISRMLVASFAATALALVVAVGLGIAGLHATQQSLVEVLHGEQLASRALFRMAEVARQRVAILHRIQASDDPFEVEAQLQAFYALGVTFGEARAELAGLEMRPDEVELLAEQRQIAIDIVGLQHEVIGLVQDGHRQEAWRLLVEDVQPLQTRMLQTLVDVLALYSQRGHEQTSRATLLAERMYWLLLAVGGVGLLLVAVVAVFTVRHVARSTSTIEAQATRLDALLGEAEFQRQATDRHNIVSVTDATGTIIYANDKFCEVSQYAQAELIGSTHRLLRSGVHDAAFYREMWMCITAGRVWQGEICNRRKDGSLYWVATTIVPFLDEHGRPYKYVSVRTEITRIMEAEAVLRRSRDELEAMVKERTAALAREVGERRKLQAELEALATTDPLTGVANRREFNTVLPQEVRRAARYGAPLSLILMDIDHFKRINDQHGHPAGDAVLQYFTSLVQRHVRDQDMLARWGGEEFALLCPHTDIEAASRIADKLRALVREHAFPHVASVTCSFGVAQWLAGEQPADLVARADAALYAAKGGGRDQVMTHA